MKQPLFKLGQVCATPAALACLEQAHHGIWEFLSRHVAGDWGVVDDEDKAANRQSLEDGSRILSAYILNDANKTKIWVITEAENDHGNRAATTLLLPSEY